MADFLTDLTPTYFQPVISKILERASFESGYVKPRKTYSRGHGICVKVNESGLKQTSNFFTNTTSNIFKVIYFFVKDFKQLKQKQKKNRFVYNL